ncbi:hypothetical protein [Enterococcus sp. UD-01]|uniref:hypothetical protein n=1 Tax=Enterococcus sp. UD-01 TaxID=3373911 RepID=UPI0038396804
MLHTPIGNLKILIDEKEVKYMEKELIKKSKVFSVDRRIEIRVIEDLNKMKYSTVKIIINNLPVKSCVETREDLQLISFYYKNLKLSMGTKELSGALYNI